MARQSDGQAQDRDLDIQAVNDRLAEWAARSAASSEALIDRFEEMGYAVRGKTEDEIAEVLRHAPGHRLP